MKNRILYAGMFLFLLIAQTAFSQAYKYETVPNDPLKARIYKLSNGLTVYMTVYKNAPRIQTYITVRAGSKNDPSDATGLAHYLEHMLFKGTDKFGSLDYSKEKPLLDKIEQLYETYRATKDDAQRKAIYHQIDSISGVAARYAIANEYDKVIAAIGGKGSNAYTSVEQTVYVCDIPSNQLEKWLTLESERFRNPEMRIFHTELEAVYEEKNRTLDSDDDKIWETLFAGLFRKHQYGTQTTIGTIDHLKNPSIKKIKEYYHQYYTPNNMAICISGDFDPEVTIKMIDEKFSLLKAGELTPYVPAKEEAITKPDIHEVVGPESESVTIGYRLPGAGTPEEDLLHIFNRLLYNGTAGLMDLNLNQKQAVLNSYTYPDVMKDYSVFLLQGFPKTGQSLDDVRKLVLAQIDLVKKGQFPDWMITAAVNDLKLQKIKSYESNEQRADAFVKAFALGLPWNYFVNRNARLEKITKKQIIDFANKYFGENYVAVNKKTGEATNVQKVVKPAITPVEVNREAKSPFLEKLISTAVPPIEPVFINYNQDITQLKGQSDVRVLYKKNEENKLFTLYYYFDFGSNTDGLLPIAFEYLQMIGTDKLTAEQVQQEFYKLGCSFSVYPSEDQIYVALTGLAENQAKAIQLMEQLFNNGKGDKQALINEVEAVLKRRQDDKLSKGTILWSGMYNYAAYGSHNPFTNTPTEKELRKLTPEILLGVIKKTFTFEHKILYYGPTAPEEVMALVNASHKVTGPLKPAPPEIGIVEQENPETTVYVVDHDMKQAEILMLSKSEHLNVSNLPVITLFSEYFGGGMASVVFQTLRESRALAYSTFASYQRPKSAEKSNFILAYIGTQADKLPEAIGGMNELLNDIPKSENLFNASKEAVLQKIRTERITRSDVLLNYVKNKKLGIEYDYRKDVFEKVPQMSFEDIKTFHDQYFRNQKFNIMVLGKKDLLDIKTLEKYGKVKYLTLTDVFGY
jgi:predicted Zn-dependent peptidase